MNIQCTMDPIRWNEVTNLDTTPCVYERNGDNDIAIYFENEDDHKEYLSLGQDQKIGLQVNDSHVYIAEG